MSNPNTILTQLAAWIAAQTFTPAVREVAIAPLLPPAAYPAVALYYDSEKFARTTDVTATLRLRVMASAGRPADAQSQARDLAQRLRRALLASQALGGTVKLLAADTITYATPVAGEPVVASAELAITAKYVAEE